MHVIVLVKQVPDVSNIPEDAWDREKGTLRRALLDSILNPLDLQALTFARRITEATPGSRTIYLSMGPPQARETLIDCLSRVPGEAILLTDRAFAGADTVATAYSLACAIRRIEREILGGSRDYVIVTGMQSVDGDTAQVPPQIAEELGIEHIAYAKGIEVTPDLRVERIGPQGTEMVRPLKYPVLITVTACMDPLYRSFHQAREARSGPVQEWSAASVGADPHRTGLQGSRTQVYRIFSPSEDRAKTCEVRPRPGGADRKDQGPVPAVGGGGRAAKRAAYALDGKTPTYTGEFWVLAEREGDGIRSVSLELLGKARELAAGLGACVGAVLPCDDAGKLPEQLIACGADKVYVIEHPLLCEFLPMPYKAAISRLVRERRPQVMLFGATPMGRELAPRVAYACDCGLTADCTKLEIGDYTKGTISLVGILKQTRPALGGNIMATILTKDSPTQMATVRPGVFKVPPRDRDALGRGRPPETPDPGGRSSAVRSRAVESFAVQGLHPRRRSRCGGRPRPALQGRLRALSQPSCGRAGQVARRQCQGRRVAHRGRGRLQHARPSGRPDRSDGAAQALPGARDLRCRAAHLGHAGLGDHRRDQQGSQGADLQLCGLRHGGRHRDHRAGAHPRATDGGLTWTPIDVLIVGAGPAGPRRSRSV